MRESQSRTATGKLAGGFLGEIGSSRDPSGSFAREPWEYKTLVASLFSSPMSLIPGAVAGFLAPVLCWSATKDPNFLIFCAIIAVTVVLRVATVFGYRSVDHDPDDVVATRRWARLFVGGATLVSTTLGANCYYALAHTSNASAHIMAISVNIAFASGFVARNAALPRFVVTQLLVFCLPMAYGLISSPDPYYRALGFFALFFVLNNIAIVGSVHRNLREMIKAMGAARASAAELTSQNAVLDAALNYMSHGLAMFDSAQNLAIANHRHDSLYRTELFKGPQTFNSMAEHLRRDKILSPEDAAAIEEAGRKVAQTGITQTRQVKTGFGDDYVVTFTPAAGASVVMLTEDATSRLASQQKIERLARFDTLTGLANRYEITKRIDRECRALARDGAGFALLFFDLDGFKTVNDTLGHDIGDALLKTIAERVSEVVSDCGTTGRLGGDEFVVLLRGAPEADVSAMAEKIAAAAAVPASIEGCLIRPSASIGVALAPLHGDSADRLLRCADLALYRAKADRRGAIVIYTEEIAAQITERHAVEAELRNAVLAQEITMAYQPIVNLRSGEIVGYEALMRWTHPARGAIGPDVFIPIAEQSGVIDKLGCFALTQACDDATRWPSERTVSVNVSPLQFHNPTLLVSSVKEALRVSGLKPERLILEVTESVLIDNPELTLETMQTISALGVRFALDDFGSGYSSLSTLSEFRFSAIKIDKSLSARLSVDRTRFTIVEAVCQLSRKLHLDIVVEGVETAEQKAIVRLMGATRGQGWHFGKPKPANELQEEERAAQLRA